MTRLITTSVISILLASLSGGVYGQRKSSLSETLSIDRRSWLTGNWKGPRDGGVLEEIWLPPHAGAITAPVRSSEESETRFVEIIHIREINGSFELTEIGSNFVAFEVISEGDHRSLSYERNEENVFL